MIFLNHMPGNVVSWITTRNYGFSDGADLFVFISGYTAAFVYAKWMVNHGFVVGATRLFKRVWQLYVAHIVLFVVYLATIGFVADRFDSTTIIHQFNVAGLIENPFQLLWQGLLLRFKPLNLDVLPLYIVLMALFPPVLWMMLRKPDLTMIASLVLYVAARQFGWNLPAYPAGVWYFNPFAWQALFAFGAWCALGGIRGPRSAIIGSPVVLYVAIAYLLFALLMTMAGRFSEFGDLFPRWLFDAFNPNDKSNLAPYRFLHFLVIVYLVVRFIPKDWPGLQSRVFSPAIKCGQQSLAVFCVGIFLSFIGYIVLILSRDALLIQIIVSAAGIAIMTAVARYVSWSKKQDKLPKDVAVSRPSLRTEEASNQFTPKPL